MGVLTEVIVARREDAPAILMASEAFLRLDTKGLDHVKLAKLRGVLSGGGFDLDWVAGMRCVADGGDEGPWVYEMPADLVEALAKLDATRTRTAVAAWMKTEEVRAARWSQEQTRTLLESLGDFARKARGEGATLLLWMSL
jgi:hypothetical protein